MIRNGVTVTVHRPAGRDRHGDPLGAGTATPVHGCAVAFVSSDEHEDNRATVVTRVSLYAPHAADIRASDTVTLPDGATYEVRGQPFAWRSPFTGWRAGTTVQLERVTG